MPDYGNKNENEIVLEHQEKGYISHATMTMRMESNKSFYRYYGHHRFGTEKMAVYLEYPLMDARVPRIWFIKD